MEAKRRVKSFEDWSNLGYRIKKGAKHVQKNQAGIPMFSEDQVYMPIKFYGLWPVRSSSYPCDWGDNENEMFLD